MKFVKGLCVALLLTTAVASSAAELRVGAAAESITPAVGVPMSGYFNPRPVDAIHDDLSAKAIVIERDGVKVALVVCDLITLFRDVTDKSRRQIAADLHIPADHIMISATHTHTGPLLARSSAQDSFTNEMTEQMRTYTDALPGYIAKSVATANGQLTSARAFTGIGKIEGISFNRRYFMKDGTVGWNPGKQNPNVVRPAGPIDPAVPVVLFENSDATHSPIAAHVSFAMHPDTIGGTVISADYPGVLAAELAKSKRAPGLTMFATGACGDVNHVNPELGNIKGFDIGAERIGKALAEETVKTLEHLQPAADGPLRAKNTILQLPLPDVTADEIAAARQTVLEPKKAKLLDRMQAFKILDVAARKGKPIEVEVQVISLGGDVAWVALPGEMFVELGLDVKKRSPFKQTIIVEQANGSIGYIPTKRAYAEGNYEPVSARSAPGSGEMIVDAAVKLLEELHSN